MRKTWIIFARGVRDNVVKQSETKVNRLNPRKIDNPEFEHFGKYALPVEVLTGSYKGTWDFVLSKLPRFEADTEAVFLPVQPV